MKIFTCLAACVFTAVASGQYSFQHYKLNTAGSSGPTAFTWARGWTYFIADDGATGRELWRFAGNTAERVTDIWPGAASTVTTYFSQMPYVNGKVYFVGLDKQVGGKAVYAFDDATKNVTMVALSAPGLKTIASNELIGAGNKLYFVGQHDTGTDIFSYDPASGKMDQITSLTSNTGNLTFCNGVLAFARSNSGRTELGIFDLKTNTVFTYEIGSSVSLSPPAGFIAYKDKLYFTVISDTFGTQLYSYSLSTGPVRLSNIAQGHTGQQFLLYKDALLFTVSGASDYDIYKYDIPGATITHLGHFISPYASSLRGAVYGDKLFMSLDSNGWHNILYVYDGVRPPYRASQLLNGADLHRISGIAVCGTKLFCSGALYPTFDGELNIITDSSVLNIKEPLGVMAAALFPNPATTETRINFTLKQQMVLRAALTDMQGKLVYAADVKTYAAGNQEIVVPVHELAGGSYFYTVVNEEGAVVCKGKLIKE